ncbi:flavin-containing monooxygenase [Nocardia testacea]|uniref:flavin-containing monooxygenase n=1 Tax=Nocardia testacea TaxID=248551 RepID=UPI003C2C9438
MTSNSSPLEHLDVMIVGAGISGIGAARYLRAEHPGKTFAIMEARGTLGGTWDLFRYPGIRSDSDLYTFGYDFKPWRDRESIATAPRILAYLRETAAENNVDAHIRYHHEVTAASWSSEQAHWTVQITRTDPVTGSRTQQAVTAGWLFCASGYYRYDEGYTPHFAGRERFRGRIVHPQHWPEDLDYRGKRVVVIGSGATAVTLLPAMARDTAHITMLQRTPSYIVPVPRQDKIANLLRAVLGEERGHQLARRKNIAQQQAVWRFCQRYPSAARAAIRWLNSRYLPADFPVDEHLNPPYNPWDQRLCAVPDGDLFGSIRAGKASMVTDRVNTFTETGILLESGRELTADIIVTATGLNLQLFGGMRLSVDGEPIVPADTLIYRGTMLTGVPNFNVAIGYTNSSWTLKIGLLCEYFCRLLTHMDQLGYDTARVQAEPGLSTRPLLDFGAGYVQRSMPMLPKQGPHAPWLMSMSYNSDRQLLDDPAALTDEHLHFSGPADRLREQSAAGSAEAAL